MDSPCSCPITYDDAKGAWDSLIQYELAETQITVDQLLGGMQHETEHCDVVGCDPLKLGKIAMAHLRETPHYYELLSLVEKILELCP